MKRLFSLFFFFSLLVETNAQWPFAKFSASQYTSCSNNSITFTYNDTIGNSTNKWFWYFEGGSPNFYEGKTPPPVLYANSGKYSIKLVVGTLNYTDSITDSVLIHQSPIVPGQPQMYSLLPGDSIQLQACTTGSNYQWTPNIASGFSTAYIKPINTVETYSCKVIDTFGCSSICNYILHSTGGSGLDSCDFSFPVKRSTSTLCKGKCGKYWTKAYPCNDSGNVYKWYLYKNAPSSAIFDAIDPTYIIDSLPAKDTFFICYNNLSPFTLLDDLRLCFYFFDPYGKRTISTLKISLHDTCPIKALFSKTKTKVCLPDNKLQVNNESSGDIIAWHWYFDGGIPSYYDGETPPDILYNSPGKFRIKLIVETALEKDSLTDTIVVFSAPIAQNTKQSYLLQVTDSIQLQACASGSMYRWTPNISSNSSSGFIHTTVRNQTYQCRITNTDGCAATCTYSLQTLPKAVFNLSNKTLCNNDSLKLTDQSIVTDTWSWFFEGGTPASFSGTYPPKIVYTTAGKFAIKLVVENANGKDSITDSVWVHPLPTVTQPSPQNLAVHYGDSILVQACAPGSMYQWTPDITSLAAIFVHPVNHVEQYTCKVSNTFGCEVNCAYTILTLPRASFLFHKKTICEGDSITLSDQSQLSDTRTWTFEGGIPSTFIGITPPAIVYPQPGRFAIKLLTENANGKDSIVDSITVVALPAFVQPNEQNILLHYGDSIQLHGCAIGDVYEWTGQSLFSTDSTLLIHPSEVTEYYSCRVSNQQGCEVTCNYTIRSLPKAQILVSDIELCPDEKTIVTDNSKLATQWNWLFDQTSPSTFTGQTPPDLRYKTAGTYPIQLIVKNIHGQDTAFAQVVVHQRPTAMDETQNFLIQAGDSLQIQACAPGNQFTWNPPVSTDSVTPFLFPKTANERYTCTILNEWGCAAVCTYTVSFKETPVFVPNAFSPNGDGTNDLFIPQGTGFSEYNLLIYNRWGQLVSNLLNEGWNGTSKSQPCSADTYIWQLSYTLMQNGTVNTLSGTVTLLR